MTIPFVSSARAARSCATGALLLMSLAAVARADDVQVTPSVAPAIEVPHPAGIGTVRIAAVGSACPAGSWDARLTQDRRIQVRFRAASLLFDAAAQPVSNDCALELRFERAGWRELSLWAVLVSSYASLEPDVTAITRGTFDLQDTVAGRPVAGPGVSEVGPFEGMINGGWARLSESATWTRCRESHTLRAQLDYQLRGGTQPYSSSLNVSADDGLRAPTVTFEILSRSCYAWPAAAP